jgi:hypothetical protein
VPAKRRLTLTELHVLCPKRRAIRVTPAFDRMLNLYEEVRQNSSPAFYQIRRFIIIFTREPDESNHTSLIFCHFRPCLPDGIFL